MDETKRDVLHVPIKLIYRLLMIGDKKYLDLCHLPKVALAMKTLCWKCRTVYTLSCWKCRAVYALESCAGQIKPRGLVGLVLEPEEICGCGCGAVTGWTWYGREIKNSLCGLLNLDSLHVKMTWAEKVSPSYFTGIF